MEAVALQQQLQLYKFDEIWTRDGYLLGEAYNLCHRTQDIDPVLQLYATYLYVVSFDIGDDYYVPLDFIAGREPDGRVTLAVTMKQVQNRTWTRIPDFVARGQARHEALPEE